MSDGVWDFVYGANSRALHAMLAQIAKLSPGIFNTTPAINGPVVEAVMVDLPDAPAVSIQSIAGNANAASLCFTAGDAKLLVITNDGSGGGFAPAVTSITATAQLQDQVLSYQITGYAITAPTLPQYQALISQEVTGALALHFENTLLAAFRLTPGSPMIDGLGDFALTALPYDAKHGALLAFSALSPSAVVLPAAGPDWLPADAFAGLSGNLLDALISPYVLPATSNGGVPSPNLSWDYSLPLMTDAAAGLNETLIAGLSASTVLLYFRFDQSIDVTVHTGGLSSNVDVPVNVSGSVLADATITIDTLSEPGVSRVWLTINGIAPNELVCNPTLYNLSTAFGAHEIDVGDPLGNDVYATIGNQLTGLRMELLLFQPITVAPPLGAPLSLSITDLAATTVPGPDRAGILAVTGSIAVAAAG